MKITYFLVSLLFWGFDYPLSLLTMKELTGQLTPGIYVTLGIIDYLVELGSILLVVRIGKGLIPLKRR